MADVNIVIQDRRECHSVVQSKKTRPNLYPDLASVLICQLIRETAADVTAVDPRVLVIPAIDVDRIRAGDHEDEDEEKYFTRVTSAIRDVSVDDVDVVLRRESELMKNPEHILKLPVGVSDDDHLLRVRRVDVHDRLFNHDLEHVFRRVENQMD